MRRTLTIAWALTALTCLFALLGYLPPPNTIMVGVVVFFDETSPFFALFTAIMIPSALLLTRGSRSWHRWVMGPVMLVALCLQLWPMYSSARIPDSKGFGFMRAMRGDPLRVELNERRIAYRADDGSPLELLLLRSPATGQYRRPTMVVIHGDVWRDGAPDEAMDVSRHFARRGYTVAALDYRRAPRHRYPAQIDDVRAGLSLLRDSARAWGIDTGRVALVGRSAGGQLALLAAYQPRSAGARPLLPIRSVVAFYAPTDLAGLYRDYPRPDPFDVRAVLRDYIGGSPDDMPEAYRAASPMSYVRPNLPPTLLLYGRADHLVSARWGRALVRATFPLRNPVQYLELGWAEHGFDRLSGGVGNQLSIDVLEQFFGQTLR